MQIAATVITHFFQGCDKYWAAAKNDKDVKNACAVIFDENCCKVKSI